MSECNTKAKCEACGDARGGLIYCEREQRFIFRFTEAMRRKAVWLVNQDIDFGKLIGKTGEGK